MYQNSLMPLGRYDKSNVPSGTTFIIAAGSAGEIGYCDEQFWAADDCYYLLPQIGVVSKYVYYALVASRHHISGLVRRGSVPRLARDIVECLEILLPDESMQVGIVDAISAIDNLIIAQQSLVAKYEAIKKATVNLLLSSKPDVRHVKLTEVAFLSTETIKTCVIDKQWYIGTENMLANCGGVEKNNAPIQYPRVRSYCQGDILISNIRPYLKKIWLADRNGGCSTDVNVIRCKSNDLQFDYLYFVLSQDRFFEYVMSNAVGTKMPRGDKAVIGDFEFPLPAIEEQARVVHALKTQNLMISNAKCQLIKLENLKQGMMSYFFG